MKTLKQNQQKHEISDRSERYHYVYVVLLYLLAESER
jgi:hypothetical protein